MYTLHTTAVQDLEYALHFTTDIMVYAECK